DNVVAAGRAGTAVAAGGDDHVLPVIDTVGHGCCLAAGGKAALPQFFAGRGVEGTQIVVEGGCHEDEAGRRGDRAADQGHAQLDVRDRGGSDVLDGAYRPFPLDLATSQVQRDQFAP